MKNRMLTLRRYAGEPDSTTRLQREPKFVKYFMVCKECGEAREVPETHPVNYMVCGPCQWGRK